MSDKSSRRTRTPAPSLAEHRPELEPVALETPIGSFVTHEGHPPFVRYYIFRPDYDQAAEEFLEKQRAGDQVDYEEAWRRLRRFGELMLAIDDYGFTADLYLDRKVVGKDEVETMIEGACELLKQIPPGPEGGVLTVHWMEELASYSFVAEE